MSKALIQIPSPAGRWMSLLAVCLLAGCQADHGASKLIGTVAPDFSLQDVQKLEKDVGERINAQGAAA